MRDLCAGIGALEEPASGTTAAALALYLAGNGALAEAELVIEQGIEMRRPSRIDVAIEAADTATVRGRSCGTGAGGRVQPISITASRSSRRNLMGSHPLRASR